MTMGEPQDHECCEHSGGLSSSELTGAGHDSLTDTLTGVPAVCHSAYDFGCASDWGVNFLFELGLPKWGAEPLTSVTTSSPITTGRNADCKRRHGGMVLSDNVLPYMAFFTNKKKAVGRSLRAALERLMWTPCPSVRP